MCCLNFPKSFRIIPQLHFNFLLAAGGVLPCCLLSSLKDAADSVFCLPTEYSEKKHLLGQIKKNREKYTSSFIVGIRWSTIHSNTRHEKCNSVIQLPSGHWQCLDLWITCELQMTCHKVDLSPKIVSQRIQTDS